MAVEPSKISFQYDPLDLTDPQAARFIRINPGLRDGLLDCELWHATECTDIAAVTFKSDPLSDRQEILVNGRRKAVERTLANFFAVARALFPHQGLWIKTICADFDNEAEQAHQNKLAPQIYYQSSNSYVWLGANDFYVSHAIDILDKEVWDARLLMNDKSMDAVRFWIGLCQLLLDEYWRRAETAQEVALPPKATVMQGEHLFSIEKLHRWATTINRNFSRNHAELSQEMYTDFQVMFQLSGLSALHRVREVVQSCHRGTHVPTTAYPRLSSETSATIWRVLASIQNLYCDNIKALVFSRLALTDYASTFDTDHDLTPFELLLECIGLSHGSQNMEDRLCQLAQLLDLTPATILMYTKKTDEVFRIPGIEQTCVASMENKSLHELSSFSAQHRQLWKGTGLGRPERQPGLYYNTTGLADLNWVNGTGCSDTVMMPAKCHQMFAVRAGSTNVFVLFGVHFEDNDIPITTNSTALVEDAIQSKDMSDHEFRSQADAKCCRELGIYETRCAPTKATIYYAIVDGSAYTSDELENRALQYFNSKISEHERKSMIWTTPDTDSMTPVLCLPGANGEEFLLSPEPDDGTDSVESWEQIPLHRSVELVGPKNDGHKSSVGRIAYSPDGKTLASYSTDDTIRLWDTSSGLLWRELRGFQGNAKNLAFSTDGTLLAHERQNGEIQIWRLASGQTCRSLVGHSKWGQVTAVAFSPDNKLVASGNINQAKIRLWSLDEDNEPELLEDYGHYAAVTALAFSPDGHLLASGSVDKFIVVWNLAKKTTRKRLPGHTGTILSIVFSPDGHSIVSSSTDKTIRLWDMERSDSIRIFRGHEDAVTSVCLSPGGMLLTSGSDDRTVRVWDLETGETLYTLRGHTNAVNSVAFSPIYRNIASASEDGTVRVWGATVIHFPTMWDRITFIGQQLTSDIIESLKKAGRSGDLLRMSLSTIQKNHGYKKVYEQEEEHELQDMPGRAGQQQNGDLTQRRTYTQTDD